MVYWHQQIECVTLLRKISFFNIEYSNRLLAQQLRVVLFNLKNLNFKDIVVSIRHALKRRWNNGIII